jgi:hypothetical protein
MGQVVLALRCAIVCAKTNVERALGEDFGSEIAVTSSSVWRGIDRAISEVSWFCVPLRRCHGLIDVSVGARDRHLEFAAELSFVGGAIGINGHTVVGTFDSGHGFGIGATRARLKAWVALVVHVDRATAGDLVASIRTLDSVILGEAGESKVSVGALSN